MIWKYPEVNKLPNSSGYFQILDNLINTGRSVKFRAKETTMASDEITTVLENSCGYVYAIIGGVTYYWVHEDHYVDY